MDSSMLKLPRLIVFIALMACMSASHAGLNLLVMGADADKDTIPCSNRIFKRVYGALMEEMNNRGFNAYDETAVTLDRFKRDSCRRSDKQLIETARSIFRPPMDVVVIFEIYASLEDKDYVKIVKSRVAGHMLQVKTGQFLGEFEMESPREWTAPAKCDRECVLETVGRYSKILATDVGAILAEKLEYLAGADSINQEINNSFRIEMNGLSPREYAVLNRKLNSLPGFKDLQVAYQGKHRSELWYETTLSQGKLMVALNDLVYSLNPGATVTQSGNQFIIKMPLAGRRAAPANNVFQGLGKPPED